MDPAGLFRRLFGGSAPLASAEAFSHFFEATHPSVFRYIYGLHGGPAAEVEDLTAETFLRAWNARHRFAGDADAALGWVITIARRLVIDSSRRNSVRRHESLEDTEIATTAADPHGEVVQRERVERLAVLLGHLPEEQREMLVLRYILGWRVSRIAEQLGLKENTVSVTIRRVLQRLRRQWVATSTEQQL
jgi:RNA polymerase sigma-70 factor, ECF subfamily